MGFINSQTQGNYMHTTPTPLHASGKFQEDLTKANMPVVNGKFGHIINSMNASKQGMAFFNNQEPHNKPNN